MNTLPKAAPGKSALPTAPLGRGRAFGFPGEFGPAVLRSAKDGTEISRHGNGCAQVEAFLKKPYCSHRVTLERKQMWANIHIFL